MTGPEDVIATYDAVAQAYARTRDQALTEEPWLRRCLRDVPPGGAVLDLGCGSGAPIGVWLAAHGYAVTGFDASAAMLNLYGRAVPNATRVLGDMREITLPDGFHAIIGWDSLFHLSAQAQRLTMPQLAAHLRPGGRLLLTVGPAAGEAIGQVGRQPVYHASLSAAEYRAALADAGLTVEAFVLDDSACGGHSLLLARKPLPHIDDAR